MRIMVSRVEDVVTVDVWLRETVPSDNVMVTDNLVLKYRSGELVGVEILDVSKLTNEDIKYIPEEAKSILLRVASALLAKL